MQELYEEFGDLAEFRIVYINEAHAEDSSWPVPYAAEKGIGEHEDYGARCSTAEMLLTDKELTIPCIIDGMDNAVNQAYNGWPDRVFVVRTDGRLAVAAAKGPWGFVPGLTAAREWLETFQETGTEPVLDAVDGD